MMATVMDRSAAEVTPGPSVPSPTASAPSAGVLDLYRSIGAAALVAVHRYRLAIVVEGLLIVAYLVLRTEDATDIALVRWLVVACAIAIVSPTSGLVVLAAVAPFNEGLALTRDIGSKSVLSGSPSALRSIRGGCFGSASRHRPLPLSFSRRLSSSSQPRACSEPGNAGATTSSRRRRRSGSRGSARCSSSSSAPSGWHVGARSGRSSSPSLRRSRLA
jgi:hypothetical protein